MDNHFISAISMTSREVAELTGKRHADVLRDIDRLLESLNADLRLGFKSSTYTDSTGKSNRQFILDRDSTYCLVAGYDANARMRIIKRWQELEAAVVTPTAPTINDPILAALVHGLVEIDRLKQQQVLITRKTEQLESRMEHVELQHRNGVPKGYLSRSQAHGLYGVGLSEKVFHLALQRLEVPTTPYIHHAEDGNEVATYGYLESDIAAAVQVFLDDAIQATRYMCESPLLEGKRFRYNKSTVTRPNPPQQ
ncbi:hypothetical protein CKO12_11435 [Chromatium okenii]|uniref:Rha family transcriptional regulator n=1 Tax=Chromatium okenii TaxID=61644 RepID=UPI001904B53A|nr:Rha family transcriptional regulator [Chromatium okenii]MBK1642478.1 hypothetical protein [Chromatium okenii]